MQSPTPGPSSSSPRLYLPCVGPAHQLDFKALQEEDESRKRNRFFFFLNPQPGWHCEQSARRERRPCEVRARSRRPTAPSKAIGFGKSLLPCPTEPHGTVRWTSKSFCERSAGWWPSTIGPVQRCVPWPCPSLSRDFELSSLGLIPDYGLPDPPPSAVPGEDL